VQAITPPVESAGTRTQSATQSFLCRSESSSLSMALPIWRGFHGHPRVRWENAMQVSAILNSRSRLYRGSIHATASALNSNSQSARFNSSRHPESSTRGNARIAAHKSCPNTPVLSTWRLISPENRSGLRSGNCNSLPLLIRHRLQAAKCSNVDGGIGAELMRLFEWLSFAST
jgi:hypothetical protein